jgi:hypothetical protein
MSIVESHGSLMLKKYKVVGCDLSAVDAQGEVLRCTSLGECEIEDFRK